MVKSHLLMQILMPKLKKTSPLWYSPSLESEFIVIIFTILIFYALRSLFLLFSDDNLSLQIIRLFLYIKEHHGIQTAFQFLGNVMDINT